MKTLQIEADTNRLADMHTKGNEYFFDNFSHISGTKAEDLSLMSFDELKEELSLVLLRFKTDTVEAFLAGFREAAHIHYLEA